LRSLNVKFYLLVFTALISLISDANSQAFIGLRVGANVNKHAFDQEIYKKFYDTGFRPGYTGGVVFLIENKEKYGLYTEFLYSQKGKYVESRANNYETHVADYQYIDIPVLFRVRFKQPKFNWYLMMGPEFNYWLGGNGAFEVYDPGRNEITKYEYEVNFGESSGSSQNLDVEEANRLQISFSVGTGLMWKLANANYISFDMRFSLGNTYIGGFESASIPNIALVDNLEYTNNILSVSAVYCVDILEKLRLSKNKYRRK
jgi:hypothetical protein